MKKTGSLKVFVSPSVDREHLIMHPNDGFDLGLMRVEHPVELCLNQNLADYLKGAGGAGDPVCLALKNECPLQTIVLGKSLFQALGEPARAVVLFDGRRLYVHGKPG